MDRQPDEGRHLKCRAGAVVRNSHEPKNSQWKAAQKILNYISSGDGESNFEVQAGHYGRRRHVDVRRH